MIRELLLTAGLGLDPRGTHEVTVFSGGKFYFRFAASFFFIRALTSLLMSARGSFLSRGRRTVALAVS